MRRLLFIVCILSATGAFAQVSRIVSEAEKAIGNKNGISSSEAGDGLKEALGNGVSKGSDLASKVDGYFMNPEIKIPFPPDARKAEVELRKIGMGKDVDRFILTLNRGAEDAASQAKPIFLEAIKQMTIQDAMGILRGQPDAATQYLKKTTLEQLKVKFRPVVQASLNKKQATKYYGDIIHTYNEIPFVKHLNPDLDSYATDLAIQGLFTLIAKEEKNIRENPVARTTDLLKRVFNAQH